jgi:hypothetical protein
MADIVPVERIMDKIQLLRGECAIEINIVIMRAFVRLEKKLQKEQQSHDQKPTCRG